ncbi:CSMD [Mytilus coruscus]|uniref:CSMD n=1 Tax=Mytilus coruscus TaxID=42192 RepID=A0A6J8C137_MYTCO|nr:CSMD [Mytilus coruscus]
MNGIDKGAHYKGKVNITEKGEVCVSWSEGLDKNYRNLDGNFCRNPDNSRKTWCYVNKTEKVWTFCNVSYCGHFCPDLKAIEHMIHPTELVIHKEDDIVHFKCDDGYILNGNPTAKCHNSDGRQPMAQWSNKQPTCTAVTCSLHNLPSTVVINPRKDHYDLSTSVNLSCTLGYTGTSVRSFCQADNTWSLKAPDCSPVSCRSINLDAHVKSSTKMPKYNDNVTLSCKEGYVGVSLSIKCYANGSWPSDRPHCRPITCSILKVDDKVLKSKNISKYNDNVTLSCKEGYNGASMTLKCNSNGVWPSQRPICTAVPCPPLNNTQHVDPPINKSGYHYGDNINFQCVEGYNLSGPPFITCHSRRNHSIGQWSDQQPLCLGNYLF